MMEKVLSDLLNAIEGWEIKPHPDDALYAAMDAARVFLARQNSAHQPIRMSELQPPADGEVAKLVEWLEILGDCRDGEGDEKYAQRYWRAAKLLKGLADGMSEACAATTS